MTATVEEVDLEKRLITVKAPKGGVVTSEVGPRVKHLDQVKPRVAYREALAIYVESK